MLITDVFRTYLGTQLSTSQKERLDEGAKLLIDEQGRPVVIGKNKKTPKAIPKRGMNR